MLFLLSTFILSSPITSSDIVYEKTYKNIGRVGYYFEYLGTVQRAKKPDIRCENIIPIDRIPKYNIDAKLNENEQQLILQENSQIITTKTKTHTGTYDIFDNQGNLYKDGQQLKYANGTARKLYRHVGDVDNQMGNVADNEPAITKRLTYRPRHNVFSVTGLYAPGGELITVRISKADLHRIRQLEVSIGPILNNGKANNIWGGREFVRMPVISNYFVLTETTSPSYGDDNDYVFYIGGFLGGPIYVKNTDQTDAEFTITISGAVRYPHYILGYTTREEFEANKQSSAPYCDVEVWQHGILHSGPKAMVENIDYDAFYDAAIYWQKVTSVSSQIPSSDPAVISVNMMYEPFIAAGAAVAFVGQGTTNCPLSWFTFTTNYKGCLQDSSCDTWGPHHEYHHHFQQKYGLDSVDCGETTNNLVTLISYSLFSAVSQRRTEEREPDGDGWNTYSSASWAINDCINTKHDYHLDFFDVFLHCFGQDLLIKVINQEDGKSNAGWYNNWTALTELDFTYFFRHVYNSEQITIADSEVSKYIEDDYSNFIPIACRYQTGIGYKIKGQTNKKMRTMYPFYIRYGEDKILDFSKQMVVPNGFSFKIRKFTSPEHGTLTKQSENVFVYKPDPNHVKSGVMTFTIRLKKDDDPLFKIDDLEIYVELQQTKKLVDKYANNGQDMLDRTIYTYPAGVIPDSPIDEYNSQFSGSVSHITILNNETNNNDNTQIMTLPGANVNNQNRVSVLEGKFEVDKGKYRIALQCRNRGALYLSYDGGKTYELGCKVLFECADERYYTDHPEIFATHEFSSPQWVYFKFVVCHKMENTQRRMFSKIGLDKYKDDGTVSDTITDLKKARSIRYEPDPTFYSKDFYPTVLNDVKKKEYLTKGTLIETNYEKYPDDQFDINSIFDDDDTNLIHTNTGFLSKQPLYLFVDLGEEVTANTMTIYGATQYQWQYQPSDFVLYGGVDRDNLEKITEVKGASVSDHNVQVQFDLKTFRYYKLNIIAGRNNFVTFRFIRFSEENPGTVISLDDDRVTLYNGWKKINCPVSTFGTSYESENANSKISLQFEGVGFYINALKASKYGTFQVFVDGVKKGDVNLNLNGQSSKSDDGVYKISGLSDSKHTLEIAGSSGIYNIDSFMILPGKPTPEPQPPKPPEVPIPQPPEYVDLNVSSAPFVKPQEPAETETISYNRGKPIDTRPIENNEVNQKGYNAVVILDRFWVIGKGHSNLYLTIENNNKKTNVIQTDSMFGIKLDSSHKEASVNLNQESINMNIKGSGAIKIDADEEINKLNLNNITVSHNEKLSLHVVRSLDSFELNNVNMYGDSVFNPSSVNSQNPTKVKAITIGEGANAKLSNIQVLDQVNIGLNAILTFSNVDLSDVDELVVSHSRQAERAAISGKIGNPPKSIFLVETKSLLSDNNNELIALGENTFTIVSAKKDDFPDCEKWRDAVNLSNSAFEKVECVSEEDEIQLVASYSNDDDESNKKNKSKAGLVAGVVVAVIVVLAVVGVVVFFVIKKKKNGIHHSTDIIDDFAVTV